MSEDLPLIREEYLPTLGAFCRALAETFNCAGAGPEQAPGAFRAGVTAECVRCGIHVSGEELFALSQPPSEHNAAPKIGRLRLGDCARQGCESYYYRLAFRNSPSLDWAKLIAQAEAGPAGTEERTAARVTAREWLCRAVQPGLVRRAALALAMMLLLLLARQWYLGGRIPFVREPEHFRVTTASPSDEHHSEEHHGGEESP